MVRTVLMSIKPEYSDRILALEKTYELRRTNVKLQAGDLVVVYASSPTKAIVGTFTVAGVVRDAPDRLWRKYSTSFGISESDYLNYFAGAELAHAIELTDVATVDPVTLNQLRRRIPGFRPPQSYQWWKGDLEDLTAPHGPDPNYVADSNRVA